MARRVKHTVRLSEEEQVLLRRAAKERGYLNPTTFIRAAIRNEVAGREIEVTSAEERIAATLERLSRDLFRANRGQQALSRLFKAVMRHARITGKRKSRGIGQSSGQSNQPWRQRCAVRVLYSRNSVRGQGGHMAATSP